MEERNDGNRCDRRRAQLTKEIKTGGEDRATTMEEETNRCAIRNMGAMSGGNGGVNGPVFILHYKPNSHMCAVRTTETVGFSVGVLDA